jgi:hypothetical protein
VSRPCLLAARSNGSGAWVNAPLVSSLDLHMSNDTVHIAMGLRLGAPVCLPHTCSVCGKEADEYGHHSLSCRASQGRTARHQMLNNIIHRSLAAANILNRLQPSGLYRLDGK